MRVSTSFNSQQVLRGIRTREANAQRWFNNEVVKDSNYFAPQDTSELIRSAIRYTMANPEANHVKWNTPYAEYQYRGLSKSGRPLSYSKDSNPNARSKWFEAAKAVNKRKWVIGVERYIKGVVR